MTTKQIISKALLSIAVAFIATASAQASLIVTASTPEFQSPDSYDFSGSGNFPPTTYQNIGTFTFAPIPFDVNSITISGTFGNLDYNSTTALADFYVGDATDGETAVNVAGCDSASADCYSGQSGPYFWTVTLSGAQLTSLSYGLTHGSIDFGYIWSQNTPAQMDAIGGDANGYDLQFSSKPAKKK